MPQRIQRKRTKGWRMPEGAVYVGRPTIWGNPYRPGVAPLLQTSAQVTAAFRLLYAHAFWDDHAPLEPLRGKDLACWCPLDQPCHADVLLELANEVAS